MSSISAPREKWSPLSPSRDWRVLAIQILLAVLAYLIATSLINPGFIAWGVPEHSDAWGYFTYSRGSFKAHDLLAPRPLMLLAIRSLGFIASPKLFVLTLLVPAVLLPCFILRVTEAVTKRAAGYLASFVYFFLCFALATFYELSALDFGGTLAGISACGYVYALSRVKTVDRFRGKVLGTLALPLLLMAASIEFKETYGALMVCLPLAFVTKARWRLAVVQALMAGAVLVILLGKDILLASPFIAVGAAASNSYSVATSLGAVVHAAGFYISWLLPSAAWTLVAVAIARLIWKRRLATVVGIAAAAALVILPMLAIPQHLVPMYSWFSSSIVLLVLPLSCAFPADGAPLRRYRLWQLALVSTTMLAVWAIARDAPAYRYWYASNQRANANTLLALQVLPNMLHQGERVLIAGPLNAYNPFKSDRFIASRFPYEFDWKVAVPQRDLALIAMSNKTVRYVPGHDVVLRHFDTVVYFDDQGRLVRVGPISALQALDASQQIAAMFCNSWTNRPTAETISCLSKLDENEALVSLSQRGPIADANAWTWFQLGHAQEQLGNVSAAHAAYVRAAAEDKAAVFQDAAKKTFGAQK